ncbi:hypothetical protein ACIO3S_08175 [Nocardioides sp. NPDC087217]|uniref:hypothetical protein n=1 Tax=Nocardioides sp. NPDC087217 TaxID=3364335 RepID=UPI0037F74A29
MKKIAIEFDGGALDARALARAVAALVDASRVADHTTFVEGFSMNPSDNWHPGDPRISITER